MRTLGIHFTKVDKIYTMIKPWCDNKEHFIYQTNWKKNYFLNIRAKSPIEKSANKHLLFKTLLKKTKEKHCTCSDLSVHILLTKLVSILNRFSSLWLILTTLCYFWTLQQSLHSSVYSFELTILSFEHFVTLLNTFTVPTLKCVIYFLAIRTSEHIIDSWHSCWFFWLSHSYLLGVECCITVAASLQAKEHIACDTPDTRLPSALLYSATHWVFQVDHVREMSSRGNADWNRGEWSEATVIVWFVIFLLLLDFIAALLG